MPETLPMLPVAFMNDDHGHALEQLNELAAALDTSAENPLQLVPLFESFNAHNRAHFLREEQAMLASDFPPYPVHKSEHDRVLVWLDSLVQSLKAGEPNPMELRTMEAKIRDWFFMHIRTMDTVTANWLASHDKH